MEKPIAKTVDRDMCKMVTPRGRVSYPHVFKPQAPKGSTNLKYSLTLLFPKTLDLMGSTGGPNPKPRHIKDIIRNAKIAKFGPKENWPANFTSPISDGDDPKYAGKEGYKGHWIIKASSHEDARPKIVTVEDKNTALTDPAEFYPGCYAKAYIFAWGWEYMGKCGVSFTLEGAIKVEDGKALGGRKPIEEVFASEGYDSFDAEEGEEAQW